MTDPQPQAEPQPPVAPEPTKAQARPAPAPPGPAPAADPANERLARLARLESQLARKDQELAEVRAAKARIELEHAAAMVAAEKSLPPAFAHRLRGATREELEADADELLAQFPHLAKPVPALKPDPAQGQQSVPEPAAGVAEGARLYASRHQK